MDMRKIYQTITLLNEGRELSECPSQDAMPPSQTDVVTMNVNMNAQGASGIRDLMQILKNIEDTDKEDEEPEIELVSLPGELGDFDNNKANSDRDVIDDSYSNSADRTVTMDIDAVTGTGDDMHSKGGPEPRKPAGGGNPYRSVDEGIVRRLNNLYSEIKGR